MRYSRIIYVEKGIGHCGACGTPHTAPVEMYEYVDRDGEKIVVDYECRMFMTADKTVSSFMTRQPDKNVLE